MGRELFPKYPAVVKKADNILGYSLENLCLEDPNNCLDQTKYTQPALYIVNALSYLDEMEKGGTKPTYVAGHSLGEYNALLAADVFNFETGLQLVKRRGHIMGQASNGKMAAIIGINELEVRSILTENKLDMIDIANLNTVQQNVISGPKKDILKAQRIFLNLDVKFVILDVSGAFHSRNMEKAKIEFAHDIQKISFKQPQISVISNYTAKCYNENEVENNLIEQMTSPVRWVESIQFIRSKGIEDIKQIGPGNVLKGLIRKIKREYLAELR